MPGGKLISLMPMDGVMFGGTMPWFSDGVGGMVEKALMEGISSCDTYPF